MKKLLLIVALCVSFTVAKASVSITNFWLDYENGVNDSLVVTWSSSDSCEIFEHHDTIAGFPNAWVGLTARVFGPGTHTFGFKVNSLIPNAEYFHRITVRNYLNEVATRTISVQTTSISQIGNLRGYYIDQTQVWLKCDYRCHGSSMNINYYRASDSSWVGGHNGLYDDDQATDSIVVAQPANTTETYYSVASNVSNPVDYCFAQIVFPITTPNYYAQHPRIDSINLVSITPSTMSVHVYWTTDSLFAMLFPSTSSDNFVSFDDSYMPFSSAPGNHGAIITLNHNYGSGVSVAVRMVIENGFGPSGLWRDTMVRYFTTPGPAQSAENLIPRILSIDYAAASTQVAVFPFHVTTSQAWLQLQAVLMNDTNSAAFSISWPVGVNDTIRQQIFYGTYGDCYLFKTVLVDSNELRQSWYIDSQPVCFTSTGIDVPNWEAWSGSGAQLLSPSDFSTEYDLDVQVTDMLGRVIFAGKVRGWETLYNQMPNDKMFVITASSPKRPSLVRSMKFVKVE